MNLKEFFIPTIGKIILFIILVAWQRFLLSGCGPCINILPPFLTIRLPWGYDYGYLPLIIEVLSAYLIACIISFIYTIFRKKR